MSQVAVKPEDERSTQKTFSRCKHLVRMDLSILCEAVEPVSSRRRLRPITIAFQEIAKSLCRILVLPHSRECLRYEQLDLRSLTVGLRPGKLRRFQCLIVLSAMVIRFAERPLRLPRAVVQLK